MRSAMAPGVDAWAVSLRYLMGAVVASGGVLLGAYKYMQDTIVSKIDAEKVEEGVPKKKKAKMSMKDSAKFLMSSPYIRDLALLVISYGMCINIVEVSWKSKLKVRQYAITDLNMQLHPHRVDSKRFRLQMNTLLLWGTSARLLVLSLLS